MEFSIETQRLLARPFTSDDAEAFFQMTRDPDMKEYLPGTCSPDSIEETRQAIETTYSKCDFKRDFYLLVEEKDTHAVVGFIEITQSRFDPHFDCCYAIHKPYRRRGYLKEILPPFLKKVYSPEMEICVFIEPCNIPSCTFIQQIKGMKQIADNDYEVFLYQGE